MAGMLVTMVRLLISKAVKGVSEAGEGLKGIADMLKLGFKGFGSIKGASLVLEKLLPMLPVYNSAVREGTATKCSDPVGNNCAAPDDRQQDVNIGNKLLMTP